MNDTDPSCRPPYPGSEETLRECRECRRPFLPSPRQRRRWDWLCVHCLKDEQGGHINVKVKRSQLGTIQSASKTLGMAPSSLLREAALKQAVSQKTGADPTIMIGVRVTREQRLEIETAARTVGVPVRTYIRDSALSFMAGLLSRHQQGGTSGGGSIGSWK